MAVCLVTGGAGFIGSHLVEALVARGHQVRVLDNFCTGLLTNLDNVRTRIDLCLGDLGNRELLWQAAQGVEWLFHLATPRWEVHESTGESAPEWAKETATADVLQAARAARVRRVICASSCSVYGQTDALRISEDDAILPASPHGFAKLAGEMHCLGFTSLYGLETVRLRYSNIFGPRQCPTSPYARDVPQIVKALLVGQPPEFPDDAAHKRDLLYIDDAIHATLLAAAAPRGSGQVYNIARGQPVDLYEVAAAVRDILGQPAPGAGDRPASPERATSIDYSRAETELGFCPSIDLKQGLLAMIEFYARLGGFPRAQQLLPAPKRQGPHFHISHREAAREPDEPELPRSS